MKAKPYKAIAILPDGKEVTLGEFDSYPECREFLEKIRLGSK